MEKMLGIYRLFIGPYRLVCSPWESVYISPNRLLMQGAYGQVIEGYGQMGLAVNSPQIMADHTGPELNFAALMGEKIRLGDENFREAAWKFRRNHLERWIPPIHHRPGGWC
ncbi:MAG TPA: molecular chaperone TorD family protein [Thermodesulfobacteriota bacterium]|nr:molecular chaperone TorD family protein [Thermodesulfobacteriota bacterium]